jgi:sensor histidine kinase YesM
LATAPLRTKAILAWSIVLTASLIVLQVMVDFDGPQPLEIIELGAVITTVVGTLLFMIMSLLLYRDQRPEQGDLPQEMLLALPVTGIAATFCFTLALGMQIVRALVSNLELLLPSMMLAGFAGFTGWLTANTAIRLYHHARAQAVEAERARAEATDAQLSALRAQMNPHFLFNTLNTVAALVRHDPAAAERTVENLSRVLRRTLDRSEQSAVPLREEIDYVKSCLAIEAQRLGERLTVEWRIDERALTIPVPTMVLQPLVENAIKHGIASRLDGGRIDISATLVAAGLQLRVHDDGPGLSEPSSNGIGLSNLKRRLQAMYGDAAQVSVQSTTPGTTVVVTLPPSR